MSFFPLSIKIYLEQIYGSDINWVAKHVMSRMAGLHNLEQTYGVSYVLLSWALLLIKPLLVGVMTPVPPGTKFSYKI
jgi:hypothetical protein